MGKILNTYGGFSATTLKTRSTFPAQGNISVGGSSIDCSNIQLNSIKGTLGASVAGLSTVCNYAGINQWSNFSPREWIESSGNLVNQVKTPYTLGSFAGYNHNALAPVAPNAVFSYTQHSGSVNTTVAMKCKVAEYDWTRLGATKCKTITYDGGSIYAESSAVSFTSAAGNWITFDNVPFSINTTSVYTQDYPTYIMLCNSAGDDLFYIPVQGTVHVEVVAAIVNKVLVTINSNPKTFSMSGSGQYTGYTIFQNGTYTGVGSADYKVLDSVTYNIYNSSTNALVSSNTYTSFNAYEYPTTLDTYAVNDTETFYADFSSGARPSPTTGQYLRVIMNYI